MCAKWNDKYNLDFIASGLEKIRDYDNSGRHSGFKGFVYEDYVSVIHSSLEFDPEIPEAERRNIIYSSIRAVAQAGKITAKALKGEFSKQENLYLRLPQKDFVLFTNLSIQYFPELKRISISGCPILFSRGVPKNFSRKVVIEKYQRWYGRELPSGYSYVRVYVRARSEFEAETKAQNALDLLRGLWNLILNSSFSIRRTFAKRVPVNQILLGPIQTLHKRGGELATEDFWYEPEYIEPLPAFQSQGHWKRIKEREIELRYKLSRHPYRSAVEEAIRRYTRALDTRDYNAAFLGLWRVLEMLTGGIRNGYDVTIRRASFIWDEPDFNQHVLRHLTTYRNRAVHEGQGTEEIETYLHQIRRYVEQLLYFHIYNRPRLKSFKEAIEFLDHSPDISRLQTNMNELREKMRLLKKAIKFQS